MKTRIENLRDQLGELLRRGKNGSWESDLASIRKAFPDWIGAGDAWSTDSIQEIAAAFAIWVLYSFHDAAARQAKRELEARRCPICKSRDCIGAATIAEAFPLLSSFETFAGDLKKLEADDPFPTTRQPHFEIRDAAERIDVYFEPDAGGNVIAHGPEFFPRVIGAADVLVVDGLTIKFDLTKLNNSKRETINNDVDAGPIVDGKVAIEIKRDSIWNNAIAKAFPLLSDLGRYEVSDPFETAGLLRIMFNGDDLGSAGTDAFDDWVQNLRNQVLPSSSDEVSLNPGRVDPKPFDRKFPGDRRGFPSDVLQASNAAKGVDAGEVLGTHTIEKPIRKTAEGVEYWGDGSRGPIPANVRRCDNCKRNFTGPAKLDAKFTFCGPYCQNEFNNKPKSNEPAVVARPPATKTDSPAAIEEPAKVRCENQGCERIVSSADTFVVCPPRSARPFTLCGVKCVAEFLGVK